MLISATQIRAGMVLTMKNDLYRVSDMFHLTPGNWRGMVQVKMKNVKTGSNLEHRFRSDERVEKAEMEEIEMEYLYNDGDNYYFMNTKNYEQVPLNKELIGDNDCYLTPNIHIGIDLYDGLPIAIAMPKTVDLLVTEADPGLKTATVTNTFKRATLETGLVIQVPHFVNEGDKIRVDTLDKKYLERVK